MFCAALFWNFWKKDDIESCFLSFARESMKRERIHHRSDVWREICYNSISLIWDWKISLQIANNWRLNNFISFNYILHRLVLTLSIFLDCFQNFSLVRANLNFLYMLDNFDDQSRYVNKTQLLYSLLEET